MASPLPRPVLAQIVIVFAAVAVFVGVLTVIASVPTSNVPERPIGAGNATATPEPPEEFGVAATPVPDVKDTIAEPDMEILSLPANLSGSGPQTTGSFRLEPGAVAFDIWNDAPGNIEVWLMYDGERLDRLLEDSVMADGPVVEPIFAGGSYYLDVTADGDWQIYVRQAEQ